MLYSLMNIFNKELIDPYDAASTLINSVCKNVEQKVVTIRMVIVHRPIQRVYRRCHERLSDALYQPTLKQGTSYISAYTTQNRSTPIFL